MQLYYTPRSHFSRKVRILLDAWNRPVELIDAGDVGEDDASGFGDHPLLQVPTLRDEGTVVFDSDHIARYLVRKLDPGDEFQVETTDARLLNARAVMNGVMAAEVEILLAKRSGIDVDRLERFRKKRITIRRGLDWLDEGRALFEGEPTYAGFHLTAMWEHLALYGLVPLEWPRLEARVEELLALPYVTRSRPPR